jgi:hypothetical protein
MVKIKTGIWNFSWVYGYVPLNDNNCRTNRCANLFHVNDHWAYSNFPCAIWGTRYAHVTSTVVNLICDQLIGIDRKRTYMLLIEEKIMIQVNIYLYIAQNFTFYDTCAALYIESLSFEIDAPS